MVDFLHHVKADSVSVALQVRDLRPLHVQSFGKLRGIKPFVLQDDVDLFVFHRFLGFFAIAKVNITFYKSKHFLKRIL